MPFSVDDTIIFETPYLKIKRCRDATLAFIPYDTYIGQSLDLYGEYCYPEARVISSMVMNGFTAIDAGANIGIHTVLMSNLVGKSGKVIAFEPQKRIFNILCTNISLNNCVNVDARNQGVGLSLGQTKLKKMDYDSTDNFGAVYLGDHQEGDIVDIVNIDQLNLDNCHFIKADIEGMETEMLEGAEKTINKFRPFLYLEDNGGKDGVRMFEKMKNLNYRCYWHSLPYFNSENYYRNSFNAFPNRIAVNMICVPQEAKVTIIAPEIDDPSKHPLSKNPT